MVVLLAPLMAAAANARLQVAIFKQCKTYFQEEDRKLLVGFLEDVMTMLSLSHAPLDSLKASFVELG